MSTQNFLREFVSRRNFWVMSTHQFCLRLDNQYFTLFSLFQLNVHSFIIFEGSSTVHCLLQMYPHRLQCPVCGKDFARPFTLARHRRSVDCKVKFICVVCGVVRTRQDTLQHHIASVHPNLTAAAAAPVAASIPPSSNERNKFDKGILFLKYFKQFVFNSN